MPQFALFQLLAAFAVFLSSIQWAVAQQTQFTVNQYFESLSAISKSQCASRGELAARFELQGKTREAHAAANGEAMMCDCVPQRMAQLRERLLPDESVSRVSEAQFFERYMKKALGVCSGEGLRRTYAASTCPADFSTKAAPANYCRCMNDVVSKLTDEEAMVLGAQTADYAPRAANAQKEGRRMPEMPSLVERMKNADAACSQ